MSVHVEFQLLIARAPLRVVQNFEIVASETAHVDSQGLSTCLLIVLGGLDPSCFSLCNKKWATFLKSRLLIIETLLYTTPQPFNVLLSHKT